MRDHPASAPAPPLTLVRTWTRTFPATPRQVPKARRFLTELLDGSPAAGDAALCVSELATNAVQHSRSARQGGCFRVHATLTATTLRVEVEDEGGPWQHDPNPEGLRGRGLTIVAALARWGITTEDDGPRTVWFEIPAHP
jgi:anti-sigma regulatory factor (Ser/Thr protein kinase)